MQKFLVFVVLLVLAALFLLLMWNYHVSTKDYSYARLSGYCDSMLRPLDAKVDETVAGIQSLASTCRSSLTSGSGDPQVNRMTIALCERLLGIRQKREEYTRRLESAGRRQYQSITGQDPEQKRAQMIESINRSWESYRQDTRASCEVALEALRKAEERGGKTLRIRLPSF